MITREKDGIKWLEFDLFQEHPRLAHALFLRHGGASPEPYTSLNFSSFHGDSSQNIHANINRVQKIFNFQEIAYSCLKHGKTVLKVDHPKNVIQKEADGLTTQKPHIALMSTYADCQCALFYDPIQQVVANIHAGWRGCVVNIYAETVRHLVATYGSNPDNLLVGVGPSLGPTRAEFINYATELPTEFLPYRINPTHFDFWAIAKDQLQEAGVLPHHIEIAQICTYDNPKDYYSYRRDKLTGRHAGIIFLQ